MSLRQLVEGDCGGVNPLMQLGGQFTRDAALKDEGLGRMQFERHLRPEEQLVHEFLGQVAAPPQSFQMESLLQEMRDIEHVHHSVPPPAHMIGDQQWSKEFAQQLAMQPPPLDQMLHLRAQRQQVTHVHEFFDEAAPTTSARATSQMMRARPAGPYLAICPPYQPPMQKLGATERFFDEAEAQQTATAAQMDEDWVQDFENNKASNAQAATDYNEKFWTRLQDEWQKMSEEADHPWLSEFNENYDPYKEYDFAEENPMSELNDALEKGKSYLAKGDIPSAVLCFEAAAKHDPQNAEVWELLGLSQAENEMDPQSIAALKRANELQPDNMRVLMALAIGYTNESLQSQALKMLTNWLLANPKYAHLVQQQQAAGGGGALASSLIRGNRLQEVQQLYLDAVRLSPQQVDPEIQEALGVLYNLSSEFDKAVDCFRAALHVQPTNAKVWNRLGASLANGTRSVEAVEAYQQALQLQPGFIRVRYNVGVCCMNLKAYKQSVEHFLTALNMQAQTAAHREMPAATAAAGGQQQMSEAIWSTLKMVVSLMGRNDLHGHVNDRNLAALNEAFKE